MGFAAIALVAPFGTIDTVVGREADMAGAAKATRAAALEVGGGGGAAGLALPLDSLSSAAAPSVAAG